MGPFRGVWRRFLNAFKVCDGRRGWCVKCGWVGCQLSYGHKTHYHLHMSDIPPHGHELKWFNERHAS